MMMMMTIGILMRMMMMVMVDICDLEDPPVGGYVSMVDGWGTNGIICRR
jgi:hypothetical protein